jgi:cell division protein FtsI (penicillin-binding protein 3)
MKVEQHRLRLIVLVIFYGIFGLILLARLYSLTILDRAFLQHQGDARSLRTITIPSFRGMIIDRLGEPLAISTPVQSIWINPKNFHASQKQLANLVKILDLDLKSLNHKLELFQNKEFFYLKRQVTPMLAEKVMQLGISGVYSQQEFKRYYPEAESLAQIIGFTNIDDKGIEGLELSYQTWLEGINGKKRVIKDRMGRVIDELNLIKEPRPGRMLQLSIDRRIQFLAYQELTKTLEKFAAQSGTVVVLDAKSGEILAMANAPSFNPNIRERYKFNTYRNLAVTDAFEPGSVMKPFAIASALESGHFQPNSIIDTRPSTMFVQGHIIRDVHSYGVLDVTGVLRNSSNVGVSKMVLTNPPEQLINLFKRCGISERTEIGYPGESEGGIVTAKEASPFVLATLSFGYGLSANAVQIARAYSVFANHGKIIPVTLLHNTEMPKGLDAMDEKTANIILKMLEAVVVDGTGKSAMVPGYRVAGKTGTALIAGKQGYSEKRYISSFVGMAPVSDPRVIVGVFIHEPDNHKGYYGAAVAAPLFSKVLETSLRLLNVPPDENTVSDNEFIAKKNPQLVEPAHETL